MGYALWILMLQCRQQQQHSLFSQASWGRLEMKPKRNKVHGSGTLIASLQAFLSKAISLEIFQSLRSLLTDSSQVSLGLPLPLFTLSTRLEPHYAPVPQEASVGHVRFCQVYNDNNIAFFPKQVGVG